MRKKELQQNDDGDDADSKEEQQQLRNDDGCHLMWSTHAFMHTKTRRNFNKDSIKRRD